MKNFEKGMIYKFDDNTQYIIVDSLENGKIIIYQRITRFNRIYYTLSNPVSVVTLTCFERSIFFDEDIDRLVTC